MATSLTSEPAQQLPQATAEEIFARVSVREQKLSRLLVFYISGGLLFMLLPGTFLGVWNLVSISGRRAAESISLSWIQAQVHVETAAQIMADMAHRCLQQIAVREGQHGPRTTGMCRGFLRFVAQGTGWLRSSVSGN